MLNPTRLLPRDNPGGRSARETARNRDILIALTGFALTLVATFAVYQIIEVGLTDDREAQVERRVIELQFDIAQIIFRLNSVSALTRATSDFDQESLTEFLSGHELPNGLRSVRWSPRVRADSRQSFEETAQVLLDEDFQIRNRDSEGYLHAAEFAPDYYPVLYSYPVGGESAVAGLNLLSNSETRQATERAVANNLPSASGAYRPIDDLGTVMSIAIVDAPVLDPRDDVDILGVVWGIIDISALAARRRFDDPLIAMIEDITEAGSSNLYESSLVTITGNAIAKDIDISGRQWSVTLEPTFRTSVMWLPITVLVLGLLLTVLAVVMRQRAAQVLLAGQLSTEVEVHRAKLLLSEQNYLALFENAATGNCENEVDTGNFVRVNERLCEMLGHSRDELLQMKIADIIAPGDDQFAALSLGEMEQSGDEAVSFECRCVRADDSTFWALISVKLLPRGHARQRNFSAVLQDISEHKASERARDLLLSELAHRLRNTMQLVVSLADQSAKSSKTVMQYRQHLQGRLRALTMAQDMLFDSTWQSVRLDRLAEATLAPFTEGEDVDRIVIDMPQVKLPPQEAQTIALAIHELASNAARHGALRTRNGRIKFSARVDTATGGEPDTLFLDWRETGVKDVEKPSEKGFGTTLLGRIMARQHGGNTQMIWETDGLHFTGKLPLNSKEDSTNA